jgi:phosphoribosyl 1,2-cyclic phosphodiesterase
MFKFCNLYSGSSGNSSFIKTTNTKILVDCGTSVKKINEALESIDESLENIDGILITHEHSDHIKGLATLCKKYDIPIYANKKTLSEIQKNIEVKNYKIFKTNENFEINDLQIHSFAIPHDAADPVGFTISTKTKKISIATDIGHMENKILKNLDGSNFVLLESNYEPDMLKSSRYPYLLKKRIMGPDGHLSNEDASLTVKALVSGGLKNVMLGHLSQENNFPELAYQTTINELITSNIDTKKLSVTIADRSHPNKIINV